MDTEARPAPDGGPVNREIRDRTEDLLGWCALVSLPALPLVANLLWPRSGTVVAVAILLGLAIALWARGPSVGIDRRTAVILAIPLIGLFAIVPAVWRWSHPTTRQVPGRTEPPWGTTGWTVALSIAVLCWAGLGRTAYKTLLDRTPGDYGRETCTEARQLNASQPAPATGSRQDTALLSALGHMAATASKSNDVKLQSAVNSVLTAQQNLDVENVGHYPPESIQGFLPYRAAQIRALQSYCKVSS